MDDKKRALLYPTSRSDVVRERTIQTSVYILSDAGFDVPRDTIHGAN